MLLQRRFVKTLFTGFLFLFVSNVYSQRTITGNVLNEKDAPLVGASVMVRGNKAGGTKTDSKGNFSLEIQNDVKTIEVSFLGHETQVVSVVGKKTIAVKLPLSQNSLDSVIVVGYSTQRKKDVTGAITSIRGEDVKNIATQDVATLLQGRVAGVEVVAASGQPGASAQITIRGVSSMYNANPLYVIDGVQQPNGNNINPQDIESYSVLKDASAAAIYGAAAAGGVIIITTKKGKGSKPTINFSSRYGVSTPKLVNILDEKDFIRYKSDIRDPNYYPGSPTYNAATVASLIPVDWNKELYQNGAEQNYNLSVSGSTPTVNYFMSGVYNNQKGVFLDNTSSMAGARINADVKVTNSIKIGEQLNVWTRNTVPVKTPIVSSAFLSQPVFQGGPVYSPIPGTLWGIFPFSYHGFNTVSQIKTADFDFPQNNFQGQVYLEAKLPIKYLTFKATFGYTSQTYENNLLQNKYASNGTPLLSADGTILNHLYRTVGNYTQELNAYILAYDHTWGAHTINLLGGFEQYANQTTNLTTDMENVLGTSFAYFPSSSSLAQGGQSISGGYDPNGLVKSIFGRLNYDFDKRFYATFTLRRDGNFTTFGPNKQFGMFPAVSSGWNIDKERFFRPLKNIVNQLKIRGSYGELGNSSIPSYSFIPTYQTGLVQNFSSNGAPQVAYTQEAIANKDIQWESTHETNIGVDGQLLEGKIYFNIDWYNKNTTKLLYNVPVSPSSGVPTTGTGFSGGAVDAGTFLENIGSVQNRGLDIAVGYNGNAGEVKYSVGATGSFNKNKVLNIITADGLPDGHNDYPYNSSMWAGQSLTRTYPGYSFGEFWGLKSLGVIKNQSQITQAVLARQPSAQVGDLLYASDTAGIIGNPYPKFTFGVNMNATWRKFDITLLFNGALGVQIYNGVSPYEFESVDGSNVTSKVFQTSGFIDGTKTNSVTKYPSVGRINGFGSFSNDPNGNYTTPSSYCVENGSYVKLKNIQIGYSFTNQSFLKAKIKTIRIYVMANNLLTITKYTGVDPELGSQYSMLGLDKNGNVVGNSDGTANYTPTNGGSASTSRGIDGPAKYPSVKMYTAGIDVTF